MNLPQLSIVNPNILTSIGKKPNAVIPSHPLNLNSLPVIGQFTDDPRLSEANSSITEPEWLGENGEVPMAFSEIRVEINRSMHEMEQRLTLQMNNIMGYVVDFRDGLETRLGKIDVRLNNIETHIGSTESSPLCQQINSGEQQPDEEEKKEDEEKVEE